MSGLEAAAAVATIVGIVGSPPFQMIVDSLKARLMIRKVKPWQQHPPFAFPPNDLHLLEATMGNVPVLLQMAESIGDSTGNIAKFITKLREVAYAAEDLMDELHYEELLYNVVGHESKPTSKRFLTKCFTFCGAAKATLQIHEPHQPTPTTKVTDDRINMMLQELDRVADRLKEACTRADRGTKMILSHRVTTSTIDSDMVYGREKEKENIAKILTDPIDGITIGDVGPNILIIGISGLGGMGKTTLAQYVFSNKDAQPCFDFKVWICVSDDYRRDRILKEIIIDCLNSSKAYIDGELHSITGELHSITSMDTLERILKEILKDKRLLLVLDDVWSSQWTEILLPLQVSTSCSKIIVTTRERMNIQLPGSRATLRCETMVFDLNELEDVAFQKLFEKYSFGDQNPDDHPRLKSIGQQIAKKLKGSPLAAKTVGPILRERLNIYYWDQVLNNDLSQLGMQGPGDIMPALLLSYLHLPPHLQRCFSYCSLFPRDHEFDKVSLVNMWIAQGYVSSKRDERLEDIGLQYFEELVSRSFFMQFDDQHIMHDLLHDLALFVSLSELYVLCDGKQHGDHKTCHHLSVQSTKRPLTDLLVLRSKHLRTVTTLGGSITDPVEASLLIRALEKVRVLVLTDFQNTSGSTVIKNIPYSLLESMGHLIHLRYLDFSSFEIDKLPKSICSLYHLQTLIFDTYTDIEFPQEINNLVNLRHLIANSVSIATIPSIGKLTNLQELQLFQVGQGEQYSVRQLEEMNEVGGKLCIRDLYKVEAVGAAKKAKMEKKKRLKFLTLDWGPLAYYTTEANEQHHDNVLECLKPHYLLEELTILNHCGCKIPSWLAPHSLNFIRHIHLLTCSSWDGALNISQLPYLEFLKINGIKSLVIDLGGQVAFPSLLELHLENLSVAFHGHTPKPFPQLRKLCIRFCSMLDGLFMPSSLETLLIEASPLHLPGCLEGLSCLTELLIHSQDNFTSFDNGKVMSSLTALKQLLIWDCKNLRSLPEHGFPSSLEELSIMDCCTEELYAKLQDHNSREWSMVKHLPLLRLHNT